MMRGSDRGFTVVDLAVAAGILGSLVLLAVPVIQRVREDSHRARCKNNLKQLGVALYLYRGFMGRGVRYPEWPARDPAAGAGIGKAPLLRFLAN